MITFLSSNRKSEDIENTMQAINQLIAFNTQGKKNSANFNVSPEDILWNWKKYLQMSENYSQAEPVAILATGNVKQKIKYKIKKIIKKSIHWYIQDIYVTQNIFNENILQSERESFNIVNYLLQRNECLECYNKELEKRLNQLEKRFEFQNKEV